VHPTSVTSAVARLEKQGYVARSRGEPDRRVVLASITDEGRAIVEKATEGLNDVVFARPGMPAGDVLALTALLTGLRAAAGDPVDPTVPGA
jgi:DNA-binding MarR family transcriptional regulator